MPGIPFAISRLSGSTDAATSASEGAAVADTMRATDALRSPQRVLPPYDIKAEPRKAFNGRSEAFGHDRLTYSRDADSKRPRSKTFNEEEPLLGGAFHTDSR